MIMTSATPKPRAGEHTVGPWRSGNGEDYNARQVFIQAFEYDDHICVVDTEANARRIVACVNFCEGVSTLELESSGRIRLREVLDFIDRLDSIDNSERELVKALSDLVKAVNDPDADSLYELAAANDLLAKHGR